MNIRQHPITDEEIDPEDNEMKNIYRNGSSSSSTTMVQKNSGKLSSEDLYKQPTYHHTSVILSPPTGGANSTTASPYSPPFRMITTTTSQQSTGNTALGEDTDPNTGSINRVILLSDDPNLRSISPVYINPNPPSNNRRTHKRSNSHNPPSNSILYTHSPPVSIPSQYLSPPYIKSPTMLVNSPPSITTTTTTTTNKNITWSPAATKKRTMKTSLDPSIFSPSLGSSTSPIDGRSPPLSPRGTPTGSGSTSIPVNHRRGISWEPSIQGKSIEALNQLIKEKKDALVQRERELLLKQKMLDSKLSSSPPSNSSSTSTPINISGSVSSTNLISSPSMSLSPSSGSNTGALPPPPPQLQRSRVSSKQHNRSKSDTTTIVKLMKSGAASNIAPKVTPVNIQHPPSPINNYFFINNTGDGPYSNTSTTTTTTTTILNPLPKSSTSEVANSNAITAGSKSPSYSKLYGTNTISPRMHSSAFESQQQQQIKQEKMKRRKSVDPNTYHQQQYTPHYLYQQQPQQPQQTYHNYPHHQNYLTPPTFSTSHKIKYHQQPQQPQQPQPQSQQQYNIQQLLNSLKSIDLGEFEEEIDNEIQQVILQTKHIQGKMELLDRVRCTAPDPLLMLFGENCKDIKKPSTSGASSGPTNNNSNTTIPSSNLMNHNNIMKSQFVSSPHLYHQNNVYYPLTEHVPVNEYQHTTSALSSTRGPDKSKSKNISSLPRSSAFSPPPRG